MGDGVWAKEGPQFERGAAHAPLELTREVRQGRFGACAALPAHVNGTVHVAVSATVDGSWSHTPSQAYSPSRATTPQPLPLTLTLALTLTLTRTYLYP